VTDERLVLREYLRVSRDSSGRECSPDEQHADHERDAIAQGWDLHPNPYRDIGSASRYARKARDDFDRMILDLKEDRFAAGGLALWEGSRGSRRVSEWALLIDLLEERGKLVWIHTHGRMYDPSNGRDRRTLLEDAVDSEYESSKSSERQRRSHAARATQGRPVSRVSFGYRRVYEEGRLLGRAPDPERSPLVEELFRRFASGEALRRIEMDWKGRGVVNGAGNPFTSPHLRDMLRNRAYIAERVHVPGKETRWWRAREDAQIYPAQWEPIVDRATFFRVQARLDGAATGKVRPGAARHLLSMIAVCDTCEAPMTANKSHGKPVYRCHVRQCAVVSQLALDLLGERRILHYLSTPGTYRGLSQEVTDSELEKVESQLAEAQAELDELANRVAAGELSVTFASRIAPRLESRVTELTRRREELATPSILRGILDPGEDVLERWRTGAIEVKRRIAQLVLTVSAAGQMRVRPAGGRPGVPIEDRVRFRRHL
jgi:DNA invertase Pin-like site-specific DNA recombinase